ncbi:elongation factor Ts [Striga asiatica]|uniref:Elongation factor Ts n=1 Tax=Striga asiatica TaxID=4170 RepID=A0A5A7PJ24_STRAF|nr:elongation factor Ts [Striga asiatica]
MALTTTAIATQLEIIPQSESILTKSIPLNHLRPVPIPLPSAGTGNILSGARRPHRLLISRISISRSASLGGPNIKTNHLGLDTLDDPSDFPEQLWRISPDSDLTQSRRRRTFFSPVIHGGRPENRVASWAERDLRNWWLPKGTSLPRKMMSSAWEIGSELKSVKNSKKSEGSEVDLRRPSWVL